MCHALRLASDAFDRLRFGSSSELAAGVRVRFVPAARIAQRETSA